ncbi:MAG TPA: hypothetical protein VGB77_21550 [Abditibacteriaceae bacterium]|jgi:hypothetical protein
MLIPLTEKRPSDRIAEVGRRILAQFSEESPERRMTMVYIRIKSKKAMNNGFVLVYDWESWPTGTLKHRGYLNPQNVEFRRPANAEERIVIKGLIRMRARIYKSWEEIEADERRVGTSEETIKKMRQILAPTAADMDEMRAARCEALPTC